MLRLNIPHHVLGKAPVIEIEATGSISSIIDLLESSSSRFHARWFRGHSDSAFSLTPALFRQSETGPVYDEAGMFHEFQRRYPERSHDHKSTFEWLTLMQHYGIPTRLLDWSSNLLVALYFCCCREKQEADGAVYILDPTVLEKSFSLNPLHDIMVTISSKSSFYEKIFNMREFRKGSYVINGLPVSELVASQELLGLYLDGNPEQPDLATFEERIGVFLTGMPASEMPTALADRIGIFSDAVAFRAPFLNERVRQQHGYFTFHGGKYFDGKPFIKTSDLSSHAHLPSRLIKLVITPEQKQIIRKELTYSGISEANLFPEMQFQAVDIKSHYTRYPA